MRLRAGGSEDSLPGSPCADSSCAKTEPGKGASVGAERSWREKPCVLLQAHTIHVGRL